MVLAEIHAAFTLLGFEAPIKDEGRVKTRYRMKVGESHPDRTKDPEEKVLREALVRQLVEASNLAQEFCSSPFSLEDLEEAEKLDEDKAHAEYKKKVQLFIGRIIQRRFRFWARVTLGYAELAPEFDSEHPKYQLENTNQKIFDLLYKENVRPEVGWALDFQVQEDMAWMVMAMTDGSYQALVFFTAAPKQSHVLPQVAHTTLTREAVLQLLGTTDLRKVRGVRGAEFWAEFKNDPWMIQVSGAGAALCWVTKIQGTTTPIPIRWARTAEELKIALPRWVQRVKAETWDGPL